VYAKYCTLCHGASGKGDGRAAVIQQRKPADLTKSVRTFEYKLDIVRRGGAALSRSSSMPAWSDVLSDAEIRAVVAYLQTLLEQDAVIARQPVSSTATASVKAK
jgi:cytochrome c oxidase cbb3-type subunit 2/cytochrome c oxidase cbb3-type subunit I/II